MADLSPVLHNPEPDGVHFLVEFFGCDASSLNSMPFWKTVLIQTAEAAGLKVLNQHFFQFTPEGITGYLLLSTSHISIHTLARTRLCRLRCLQLRRRRRNKRGG